MKRSGGLLRTLPKNNVTSPAASYGNAGMLATHAVIPNATPWLLRNLPGLLFSGTSPLTVNFRHIRAIGPWLLQTAFSGLSWNAVERTAGSLRNLLRGAVVMHKALAHEAGVPELIDESEALYVYCDRSAFDAEVRLWNIRRNVGIQWQELSLSELRTNYPQLPAGYKFGIRIKETGRCTNPGLYLSALYDLACTWGMRRLKASASDFVLSGKKLKGIVTDQGVVDCGKAVLAAGIHSPNLALRLGEKLMIQSERGYHYQVRT